MTRLNNNEFKPGLTLSCNDNSAGRFMRLADIVERLEKSGGVPPGISRLHNHSARLVVCWRRRPVDMTIYRRISEAWAAWGESSVLHIHGGDPSAEPFLWDIGQ